MGSRMAPSYTNLFKGKLEQEFLRTKNMEPRVWWRFIDDIFAIWIHGEQALCRFIQCLNYHHPTIKFTALWLAEQVTFLDTMVYIKDGQIRSVQTSVLNPRTNIGIFSWTISISYIAKSPFHTAKRSAFDKIVQGRKIFTKDLAI